MTPNADSTYRFHKISAVV